MISDELRRKVARLAAQRVEQKRQGIAVGGVAVTSGNKRRVWLMNKEVKAPRRMVHVLVGPPYRLIRKKIRRAPRPRACLATTA